MRLVLASTSPRRREILALLGLPFEVVPPDFAEIISSDIAAADEALDFAVGKAQSAARARPDSIVIGSDTMIALGDEKIGKPEDLADARRILRLLSGKLHVIYTSVVMIDPANAAGLKHVEKVLVTMRPYSNAEITRYLESNESMDKAGAYSIQGNGRELIARIDGDYLAAVGLPLKPLAVYLKKRGIEPRLDIDRLYAERSFLNWNNF